MEAQSLRQENEQLRARLALAEAKAAELDNVFEQLQELGFGTDDPISGSDCIDKVGVIFRRLSEALSRDQDPVGNVRAEPLRCSPGT